MVTVEKDLVIQNGRILGRLERWDIPAVQGRRCHQCNQLIPVPNWEYHQHACHQVGWGRYHCTIARFTPRATKRRRGPKIDFVAELAGLLK
jgi:hypothetical protein